jgi:hypothetical protein
LDEPVARPAAAGTKDELKEQQRGCRSHESFYPDNCPPWIVEVGGKGLQRPRHVQCIVFLAYLIHGKNHHLLLTLLVELWIFV